MDPSGNERKRNGASGKAPGGFIPMADATRERVDASGMSVILPDFMDSLTDAVVVLDAERRIVAANRRYLESFGLKGHDGSVVGVSCTQGLNCPQRTLAEGEGCPACEVRELKRPIKRIHSVPDARGEPHRWEATFNPILDARGQVSHVVEVWRDISDRSMLEAQIAHSERLASVGLLAAGVGHEINNPLASVLAGVESLGRMIDRGELGPAHVDEVREIVQMLEREVVRCRETTDKLMLLAQPYSQAPSRVDLNRAVRDTLGLLRFEMRRHHVEAEEDLDPRLPEIWARESGMRGVCMNLMMNAVQAMTSGGTLRVSTAARGREVELRVEDTGPGIPPHLIDRIFDPFFTTKPAGKGTGLGLSVTQRVVARQGGRIRAENRPEGGARFIVELFVDGPGGSDR